MKDITWYQYNENLLRHGDQRFDKSIKINKLGTKKKIDVRFNSQDKESSRNNKCNSDNLNEAKINKYKDLLIVKDWLTT
ncbi:24613_t:CDS:2, partial [Racocetra persica]